MVFEVGNTVSLQEVEDRDQVAIRLSANPDPYHVAIPL
jgi:hypothetical protein